jgi:hypothetical protein
VAGDVPLVPVDLLGVRQYGAEEIVVLLLDASSELVVPIAIGPREASAIATAQAGIVPPRPMPHDVMRDLLGAMGVELARSEVVALDGGVFFAELVLSNGARIDARASDAIALAVRTCSPVWCAARIVAEVGVEFVSTDLRSEVDRFRAFLHDVEPEDFAT